MNIKYLLLLALLVFGMAACGDDDEEEMVPPVVDAVTYTNDIAAILNTNCTIPTCHNDTDLANGFSLDDFQQAAAAAAFSNFLPAINHEPGFSPMPRNADQLPQGQIDLITAWVDAGFPE